MSDGRAVRVADGTLLSATVSGDGSPLVLVHGTTGSKAAWAMVVPLLVEHHTVWAYDRRGRGQSGDGAQYSLEHEIQDLEAIVDAAGAGCHVCGHSFGGTLVLEAAARRDDLSSVVVYEPVVHPAAAEEPTRRALGLLNRDDVEGALAVFLSEVAGLSGDEIAIVRSMPEIWERMLDTAPTITREVKALMGGSWEPARYRSLTAPLLLLRGGDTRSPIYPSIDEMTSAVPHAESFTLSGQRHLAAAFAPEMFAEVVLQFTKRPTS